MKRTILKIQVILIVLTACVVGCNNINTEEEINTNTEKEIIVPANSLGKWKLVNVTFAMVGESNDYSEYNIVYEFKTNNVLTISGKIEGIELYRGHCIGEHTYAIMCIDYEDGYEYRLTIDTTTYGYQISSEGLKFDNLPLDGPVYTFVKFD